jgi:type II secretory pathway component PulJ
LDIDALGAASHAAAVHLTDLLVAVAVLGLLMGSALALLQQGQHAFGVGAARVEAQQSARVALSRLASEIRGAGFGPARAGGAAIAVAEPQRIVIQHDLDGNGLIAGNGETVTWRLAGRVLRRDAGGGAQPIINGVRDLRLTYLDADERVTAALDAIRAVVITLTTEPDHATSVAGRTVETTVTTTVRLRNR